MEITDVIRILAKRWLLLVAAAVLSVGIAGVVAFCFLANTYEATSVMIIGSMTEQASQNQMTLNDYNLNIKLVNSYRVLCKTDRILKQVLAETGLSMTSAALSDKISVTAQSDTEIINITVEDENPDTAAQVANAVANVFRREIPQIMRMDNVQVIDRAYPATLPTKPDRKMILILSGLVGLLLGAGIAVLIEYFDVRIKSADQLAKILGAPSLGSIPHLQERARQ